MLQVRHLEHLSPNIFKAHSLRRWLSSASSRFAKQTPDPSVQFQSNLATRAFILDNSQTTNIYDIPTLNAIRSKVQAWDSAHLCTSIIGINQNKHSALADDVTLVSKVFNPDSRGEIIESLKKELELSQLLASLNKPYVAVMNGHAMGGISGLALHAPFRVATENTVFSMPQTGFGYISGGGANFALSRLDGAFGAYLSLTGFELRGRAVFEHGIATHYIPARRIPDLVDRLSSLEEVSMDKVDGALEDLFYENCDIEDSSTKLTGDTQWDIEIFSLSLPEIMETLEMKDEEIRQRAKTDRVKLDEEDLPLPLKAFKALQQRSPNTLRIALEAVRRSKNMTLEDVLQMEMRLATTYVSEAERYFSAPITGDQITQFVHRYPWTAEAELQTQVIHEYFDGESSAPKLSFADQAGERRPWLNYGLPSQEEIRGLVTGVHFLAHERPLRTVDALRMHFHSLRGEKHGLEERIDEVVKHCCVQEGEADNKKLVWVRD
ncbi:hypothetical protein M422DRAFT_30432 [Sphaerobolus stellatus SS14]|uniref:3-hydroxyisobutyryl-CoA hydrolase n=1 Tax=Sphaerobolus stellatus (strain SS14) TaxID=990650 RepID=A0A0C9VZ01_SPHS4|nr:hypothetical protein M422DRAFT_30432 [Sphaerobolus stellatus SS14]